MNEDVREFIALKKRKKFLDEELKEVNQALTRLEEPVLNYFQKEGVNSINTDAGTVYIKTELWAKKNPDCDIDDAISALREAHLDEYAKQTINVQGLSAYFRAHEDEYPESLKGKVDINKYYKPIVRLS